MSGDEVFPRIYKDVCVCMIDVVNFSEWCKTKTSNDIFRSMTEYNSLLVKLISEYDDLEKIELVGDCAMVVSGFKDNHFQHVINMIMFAIALIENLNIVRGIFDEYNSLRIGIHTGEICRGIINYPTKTQLFGSCINITSRLESYSIPGTFTISDRVYDKIKHLNDELWFNKTIGKQQCANLKGVGKFECFRGFVNKEQILIADDDQIVLKIFEKVCSNIYNVQSAYANTINETFAMMKENVYSMCIVDLNFINIQILSALSEFREWESYSRNVRQKIVLTTMGLDSETKTSYERLVDGFIDKSDIHRYYMYPSFEDLPNKLVEQQSLEKMSMR